MKTMWPNANTELYQALAEASLLPPHVVAGSASRRRRRLNERMRERAIKAGNLMVD